MSKVKSTVDLAGGGAVRVSKIRRDPLPAPKAKKVVTYRDDNEKRNLLIGIALFGAALFIIVLQFSDFTNNYFN